MFNDIVRDCIRSGCLAGWGSVYCSVVVVFSDVRVTGLLWVRVCVCDVGSIVKLSGFCVRVHGASGSRYGVACFFSSS